MLQFSVAKNKILNISGACQNLRIATNSHYFSVAVELIES